MPVPVGPSELKTEAGRSQMSAIRAFAAPTVAGSDSHKDQQAVRAGGGQDGMEPLIGIAGHVCRRRLQRAIQCGGRVGALRLGGDMGRHESVARAGDPRDHD
mgnify:CR=1 FL=1